MKPIKPLTMGVLGSKLAQSQPQLLNEQQVQTDLTDVDGTKKHLNKKKVTVKRLQIKNKELTGEVRPPNFFQSEGSKPTKIKLHVRCRSERELEPPAPISPTIQIRA